MLFYSLPAGRQWIYSGCHQTLHKSWISALVFHGFCATWTKKQKQELVTLRRAVLELALPWARCVGRSQSEGRWSSIASTGVVRG